MKSLFDKFFFRTNNLDYICKNIRDITNHTSAYKIFNAINSFSLESEIRYVGGCIRKIINNEKVDDIDLATNLLPQEVCHALKKENISYYETGLDHGTITAVIDKQKFEITTLREDISTDGRHANVKFSKSWKDDSLRRDFTINSIYSDREGNLFDPHNGKQDLENGLINFIGDENKRIKEDYLRILRYIRFFLNYSKQPHNLKTVKSLRMNINGVSKLSKERLLDELKKTTKLYSLEKLSKDKICLELVQIIFPELKHISIFTKLDKNKKNLLNNNDFIFFLSLMTVDESDNVEYFLYKYNLSKKDQKRIRFIHRFFQKKIQKKTFTENNMNNIFYYEGKDSVIDILKFKLIKSKKIDNNIENLINLFDKKIKPIMPINADMLIRKYKVPKGRMLGDKLRMIEEEWASNNFEISEKKLKDIIDN
tara:strand:- start:132 stop:1406 length:1275 start_codon:yes stop_codon:yes gene_type:complete